MTTEDRKQIVRQVMQDVITMCSTDPMLKHPGLHEIIPTTERSMQFLSDRTVTIPLQFCDGEWVATQAIFSGTHDGQRVEYEVLSFNRVVDGVIIQQHSVADIFPIMQAMGVQMPTLQE